MKTLQEIQEFNRKAIIMACNPEAKSYAEALKMELDFGCRVILGNREGGERIVLKKQIGALEFSGSVPSFSWAAEKPEDFKPDFSKMNRIDGKRTWNEYYTVNNELFYDGDADQIIGKPLTLNRVLLAWGRKNPWNNLVKGNNGGEYLKEMPSFLEDWDLTKPTLKEQSEETQRSIFNLLGGEDEANH